METWVCWRPELSRLHPTTSLKHCLDQKPPEKLRLHRMLEASTECWPPRAPQPPGPDMTPLHMLRCPTDGWKPRGIHATGRSGTRGK